MIKLFDDILIDVFSRLIVFRITFDGDLFLCLESILIYSTLYLISDESFDKPFSSKYALYGSYALSDFSTSALLFCFTPASSTEYFIRLSGS